MTEKTATLTNLFTKTEKPFVDTSHSWREIMWSPNSYTPMEPRLSDSWLRAMPIQQGMPEQQLWRVQRLYADNLRIQEGQMTYEAMLEKLKAEELRIAKAAGMTGSDDEIVAERLKVATRNNVLRVIAAGKVPQEKKLNGLRAGWTAAAAIAAAGFLFSGSDTPAPVNPATQPVAAEGPVATPAPVIVAPEAPLTGTASFDYSTNDGYYIVGEGARTFGIRFSKASNDAIHVYNYHSTIDKVARVKDAPAGAPISFDAVDSSSRAYTIQTGETFLMKNKEGYYLQARIRTITDDSRGDAADKVVFEYQINAEKNGTFIALADGKAPPVTAAKLAVKQPRP